MFKMNRQQLDKFEKRLERLNKKGVHFAERDTINDLAKEAQKEAKDIIRAKFIKRNTWTTRSIWIDRARSLSDSAEVGSVQEYMAEQEFGSRTSRPLNVPTPAASGESVRANKRLRPVRAPNRISRIKLKKRSRRGGGLTRKQQNVAAVRQAADEGRKHVYLDRGKRKGIFRLLGGKRHPRVRLIQDLSRRVRIVPRNPWLMPATKIAMGERDRLYRRQLVKQIRRAS